MRRSDAADTKGVARVGRRPGGITGSVRATVSSFGIETSLCRSCTPVCVARAHDGQRAVRRVVHLTLQSGASDKALVGSGRSAVVGGSEQQLVGLCPQFSPSHLQYDPRPGPAVFMKAVERDAEGFAVGRGLQHVSGDMDRVVHRIRKRNAWQ